MTQGFYEQLGVDPRASTPDIRTAYTRVVAGLVRRRKAIVEQGGDPSPLDLSRSQADEAWEILSDAARRRRYDAMRALTADGWTTDGDELWKRVSGALVHPAAGAAAELLRVVTNLKVGVLPPDPAARPAPRVAAAADPVRPARSVDEEVTVTATHSPSRVVKPRKLEVKPAALPPPKPVPLGRPVQDDDDDDDEVGELVPLPTGPALVTEPGLRVVDGPGSAVIVMPTQPKKRAPVSTEDIARLVDKHGWSGALLRSVREARGMSLQDLSETTRISAKYLEAIESDQNDRLPAATFVRGYVRQMARTLSLDEEATVAGYMRRHQG